MDREHAESLRDTTTTHTIYESSSESMEELDDESVHLVVTSPPYGSLKDYGSSEQIGYGDSEAAYLNRLSSVWEECYRVLHPGCRLVINIGDQYHSATDDQSYHITPLNALVISNIRQTTEFDWLGNIIWHKFTNTSTSGGAPVMGSFGQPRNGYIDYNHEYINIFRKPGDAPQPPAEIKAADEIDSDTWMELFDGRWEFPGAEQTDHLAPFPKKVPQRLIRMFSFRGDTVLDPFAGSGTTTMVADELDRSSVGYEIGFEVPEGAAVDNWREVIRRKVGYHGVSNWKNDERFTLPEDD